MDKITVTTLQNLGAQFTEETKEVWCTWADAPAFTNENGGVHFCQFCGSTEHEEI